MPTYDRRVQASADDGMARDETWYVDEISCWVGIEAGVVHYSAFRWVVDVPKGATITSAYLKGYGAGSIGGLTRTKISGIAEDDTANFVSNPIGRPETSAKVDWDIPEDWVWTEYTSPDIKSIIQEIVNRLGWRSGNHLGLFWKDDGTSDPGVRALEAFDWRETTVYTPRLVINYITLPEYALTLSAAEGGTTDPSPGIYYVTEGETFTALAIPLPDFYSFLHWTLNGEVYTDNPVTIRVTKDAALTAHFTPLAPPIPGVTITVDGVEDYTKESGKAPFEVEEGTYTWVARKEGYLEERGTVNVVGDTNVEVLMTRVVTIRAYGVATAGAPAPDMELWLTIDGVEEEVHEAYPSVELGLEYTHDGICIGKGHHEAYAEMKLTNPYGTVTLSSDVISFDVP